MLYLPEGFAEQTQLFNERRAITNNASDRFRSRSMKLINKSTGAARQACQVGVCRSINKRSKIVAFGTSSK
jgi:hypothetical protein